MPCTGVIHCNEGVKWVRNEGKMVSGGLEDDGEGKIIVEGVRIGGERDVKGDGYCGEGEGEGNRKFVQIDIVLER